MRTNEPIGNSAARVVTNKPMQTYKLGHLVGVLVTFSDESVFVPHANITELVVTGA